MCTAAAHALMAAHEAERQQHHVDNFCLVMPRLAQTRAQGIFKWIVLSRPLLELLDQSVMLCLLRATQVGCG